MPFLLKESDLKRLCQIGNFAIPEVEMVFFGFRGLLPLNETNHAFLPQHSVQLQDVNYLNPRCTLVQWRPTKGDLALFPASTVPHSRYMRAVLPAHGNGVNALMTGYYKDYRKGVHKAGRPTAHDAFRQTQGRPIRRTGDDLDYDNDDRVEFVNPYDNLHAGWCQASTSPLYASMGCQVIVGYPKCAKRGNEPAAGPWKEFQANAYAIPQQSFPYILLNGREAQQVALQENQALPAKLRFGSSGPLVSKLQNALKGKGFYEGQIDNDFGERTIRAVLAFQTFVFGPSSDDGIVGPVTATALGLDWPEITAT